MDVLRNLPSRRVLDDVVRCLGVHVGLFIEQAKLEHFHEETVVRLIDTLHRDHALLNCCLEILNVVRVSNEIGSSVNCLGEAPRTIQILHTPTHVVGDTRVGVDVTLVAHALTQYLFDEVPVERESDFFKRDVDAIKLLDHGLFDRRCRVVRHHRTGLDRSLEAWHVILLERTRCAVDVPLTFDVMRIKTVLTRATARVVFGGQRDRLRAEFVALEALNDAFHGVRDQVRIFTEGAVCALPARVGDHVSHVHVTLTQAGRSPLLARCLSVIGEDLAVLAESLLTENCCRNAHRCRERRKHAHGVVHAEHEFAVVVTRIRCDDGGDAQTCALCNFVHRVVPPSELGG